MIGEWIRFGVTALCVVGGLFALLTALLGLFRFDLELPEETEEVSAP